MLKQQHRRLKWVFIGSKHGFFARYYIVMLKDGAAYAEGCPKTVLTKPIIHQVFQASVEIMQHPTLAKPAIVQTPS